MGIVLACLLLGCTEESPEPARCTLRVAKSGVFVDGDAVSPERAVTVCRKREAAVVIVADDAPPEAWPRLRARLEREHVRILMRGTIDDRMCLDNPLAKGCY
jgi:hypothetical protein